MLTVAKYSSLSFRFRDATQLLLSRKLQSAICYCRKNCKRKKMFILSDQTYASSSRFVRKIASRNIEPLINESTSKIHAKSEGDKF